MISKVAKRPRQVREDGRIADFFAYQDTSLTDPGTFHQGRPRVAAMVKNEACDHVVEGIVVKGQTLPIVDCHRQVGHIIVGGVYSLDLDGNFVGDAPPDHKVAAAKIQNPFAWLHVAGKFASEAASLQNDGGTQDLLNKTHCRHRSDKKYYKRSANFLLGVQRNFEPTTCLEGGT
jgi:hypothetical protein